MKRHASIERHSPFATRSAHERYGVVTRELVAQKAQDARNAQRGREIHVLHSGDPDPLHRMLNAMQPGSYVAPHRHLSDPKSESIVVLQGTAAFIAFSEAADGSIEDIVLLDRQRGVLGVDIRVGVWHTFFALEPDTVVFEVKEGPYDPTKDKDFAPWAPREGAAGDREYLAQLEDRARKEYGLPQRTWRPPP